MSDDDSSHPYLTLADELFTGEITEEDLPAATPGLPPLTPELLIYLAGQAERFAASRPRRGWAIAQVARDASLSQGCDLFVQSLASWYLGRACNHWTQPKRVREAISFARRGFEELAETGWVAACEWQLHHLSWTQPNFAAAAQSLQQALGGLEKAGLTGLIPDCRLALAYAQILTGEHESAIPNIQRSEEDYVARADVLNQARCWLHLASSLRRRDRFEEAYKQLARALAVFEAQNALTDQAKAHYQMGLGHLLKADDLSGAVSCFERAAELFQATDLDLWHGLCSNNLGAVYMMNGELSLALTHYEEARACFIRHEILGSLADNLNDSADLNLLLGRPILSVEQFRQSELINQELGAPLSAAVAISNLGIAYGQLGRYQDALFHLERAIEALQPFKIYFRLAACEKYIASIWSRLGRPELAHGYLDQAAAHYEMTDQKALLASVHNYRAATFFQQGLARQAVQALERSLRVATTYGLRPQSGLAKRLLGEAFLRVGDPVQALAYLKQAQDDFIEMGMTTEHAFCLISLGSLYRSLAETEQARTAFEEALRLGERASPEVDWRAHVELGDLAEARADLQHALTHYHAAANALGEIRQNFLQPSLAGSYLQTPAHAFDRIVVLSSKAEAAADVLQMVETAKASTLLRHLNLNNTTREDPTSQEIQGLKAEIDLLQQRLRVSLDETPVLQSGSEVREMRARLRNLMEQYDHQKMQLERRSFPAGPSAGTAGSFDLDQFCGLASASLEMNWAALNYYFAGNDLITLLVTPSDCRVYSQAISKRLLMALDACDTARRTGLPPPESDLRVLGKALLPNSLAELLTPDTHLLLAPHRRLHQVPWAALTPEHSTDPLVSLCVPSLTPSLQSLALLWERPQKDSHLDRTAGLLVGLSSFQGLHEELPLIREEVEALRQKLGPNGQVLAEDSATWENFLQLKLTGEGGLARFAWLHLASHFFPDRYTGRLSGIALRDGDIWLDQLRDLSPLPRLVSLSACNSNDAFLYEGDERVDLQTTCFLAGANSVVGSAWPVLDGSAGALITHFYDEYLAGASPARAAASAQRRFIKDGQELKHWASFVCAGVP